MNDKIKNYRQILPDPDFKPLRELLPLQIPLSMIIDPTNICNFRCKFCPTSDKKLLKDVGRANKSMDFDLFCKIIDDLSELTETVGKKLKRLHLMKDGEPLLNKRFCDMVSYIKKQKVTEYVATSSNGALLTPEMAQKLIDSGLDVLRISVIHPSEQGYLEVADSRIGYEQIKENVAFLFKEKEQQNSSLQIFAKVTDVGLNSEQKNKFINEFSPICDALSVEKLHNWAEVEDRDFSLGISEDTGWDGVSKLMDRKICPEPFTKLAVNSNGEVSVCCVDWSHGTVVGDLRHQTIMDVWQGKKLQEFRNLHLSGCRNKIKACSNCGFIKGFPEYTMLDDDAERLMKVYS